MKSHIFTAAIALLLTSCMSENEQNGLDYIGQIYDANTAYSKSFDNTVGSEAMKKFNVKLSNSKMIDSLTPTITTANVALLMYKSMTDEEQDNYTHIDVELVNTKNDTVAYYYPTDALEAIDVKFDKYEKFSESLVSGDFHKLDALTDKSIIPGSIAKSMGAKVKEYEGKHGKLIGYHPFGLSEENHEKGKFYQFQGHLLFENNKKVPYFVVVLVAPEKDDVVGFRIF